MLQNFRVGNSSVFFQHRLGLIGASMDIGDRFGDAGNESAHAPGLLGDVRPHRRAAIADVGNIQVAQFEQRFKTCRCRL